MWLVEVLVTRFGMVDVVVVRRLERTRSNGKNHCQLLRAAAEAMLTFGRAIRTRIDRPYGSTTGPMCALGALDYAAGNDPMACQIDLDPIVGIIQTRLGLPMSQNPHNMLPYFQLWAVANWSNNAPNDQVVIDGFLRVASELEAEGLCSSEKA